MSTTENTYWEWKHVKIKQGKISISSVKLKKGSNNDVIGFTTYKLMIQH